MPDPCNRFAVRPYVANFALTVVTAVVGQGFLQRLPAGQGPLAEVQQVGYLLTGLFLLGGVLLFRRGRGVRARAQGLDCERQGTILKQEYRLLAWVCPLSALLGVLYWGLGGRLVERHARTFIALGPVAFLVLAPRSLSQNHLVPR
jgi:hypothetical protein